MPDWIWLIALFPMLTFGYLVGFVCGNWKTQSEMNSCPSENAYIREAEIFANANKEIEIRRADLIQKTEIEKYKISAEQIERQYNQKPEP